MINGAHAIIFSTDADADRTFLRDILGLPHVDVGGGWLIFGLPPSEVAVHPTDREGGTHELYFMCSDVEALKAQLSKHEIESSPVQDQGWGLVTQVTLPGGGKIGVYEPRHARPEVASSSAGAKRKAKGRGAAKSASQASRGAKNKKKASKRAPSAKAPKAKKAAKKKAAKRGRA
jgi:catechol 2,3-dioxygenase-like lactoylglutathione lyase family enzyme